MNSRSIPFELKSNALTVNGFSPEFEDKVLEAAQDKEEIGPFESANAAVKALRKSKKKP